MAKKKPSKNISKKPEVDPEATSQVSAKQKPAEKVSKPQSKGLKKFDKFQNGGSKK